MPTITTQSYFVRERRLPAVQGEPGLPTEASSVYNAVLNDYIAFYEPEFLKLILGDDLYAEYTEGRTTVQKWIDFDAYMFNPEVLDSCVADYIFCKYWKDVDTVVGDGTHLINGDNPTRVGHQVRTIPVWNRMVDGVCKAVAFLTENYDTYCTEHAPNYEGWAKFIWSDGYEFKPLYQNSFGI